MQQMKEFTKFPADPQTRRRVYCYLGLLQSQYQFAWQNQGAMDELYEHSEMVLAVLEEDLEDTEDLSIIAMAAVINVRGQAGQFAAIGKTYDEVIRQHLLKRMTPLAVVALESVSTLDKVNTTADKIAGKARSPLRDVDAKIDSPLDHNPQTQPWNSSSPRDRPGREKAHEGNTV